MSLKFLFTAVAAAVILPLSAYGENLDCVKCHIQIRSEPVVHQALDMGCDACHSADSTKSLPHKKDKIEHLLTVAQPEICFTCHDQTIFNRKTVHAAIGMGCTACHSPHSSKNPKLLRAETPELCYGCHDKTLFTQKSVHPALDMGCTSCHDPHSSVASKLLSSEQPDLCYGCHDKSMFSKKHVHAAVGMGCTGCHNPHSSKNPRMLVAEPPALCLTCHDKSEFSKNVKHGPTAAGLCLSCHLPHASDEMSLLVKKPYELCLTCHPGIPKQPHVVSGFSMGKHPLGEAIRRKRSGKMKRLKDPVREGRPFYCGSCHDPHSAEGPYLFRFKAMSAAGLCVNCHQK